MIKFEIIKEYLKSVSFSSTKTPAIFFANDNPQITMGIDVNTQVSKSNNGVYDVTLDLGLSPQISTEEELFHFEISYAAIVVLNIPNSASEEDIRRILMIDVPQTLFPVVRHIVNQQIYTAGFPPVQFPSISFEQMYMSKAAQDDESNNMPQQLVGLNLNTQPTPLLSYRSIVSKILSNGQLKNEIEYLVNQGMDPEQDFEDTPMYKYLMRYIDVPEYNTPEFEDDHFDYSFYEDLYRMLMMGHTVKYRFDKTDSLEIYVTTNVFKDKPISGMTYDELESFMTSLIVGAWMNTNVYLACLFNDEAQDNADEYLDGLISKGLLTFTEYSGLFLKYADQNGLIMERVKLWYNHLQRIDIETIPYRF